MDASISQYAEYVLSKGTTHAHDRWVQDTQSSGITSAPLYKFHPAFHKVLSEAILSFNLDLLSREQETLFLKYLEAGDTIPIGNCTNDELNQLDIFLGSILEDSDEFCN